MAEPHAYQSSGSISRLWGCSSDIPQVVAPRVLTPYSSVSVFLVALREREMCLALLALVASITGHCSCSVSHEPQQA